MRHYYFDFRDDSGLLVDDEGIECRDMRAVQWEAGRSLADMVRDAVHASTNAAPHIMSIEVRDEDGPVMQARLTLEFNRRN